MCGIAGLFSPDHSSSAEQLRAAAERIASKIRHRGPDDAGFWSDEARGIALVHRRLAVIDVSSAGHQPMESADGRYVVVYNGEIYNFHDLRADLERAGATFTGHSDTEALLAAICEWGLVSTLRRCNGMFAFGLWDRKERTLTLARDRLGEKPLYFGWIGGTFVFASELRALIGLKGFDPQISQQGLGLYFRYGYVPGPHSIIEGISKLPPGTTLQVRAASQRSHDAPEPYWSLEDSALAGLRDPVDASPREIATQLEELLRDSVQMRLNADVGLGAFLSGGIDSSLIVSLMQELSGTQIKTFAVGFDRAKFDESQFAADVARQVGSDHRTLHLTGDDALDMVPLAIDALDEPFADPSQIPTLAVSRFAREHVTVSLTGDGGDELFGGYARYHQAERIEQLARIIPGSLRRFGGRANEWRLPAVGGDRSRRRLRTGVHTAADRGLKLAWMLEGRNAAERYDRLLTRWPSAPVRDASPLGFPDSEPVVGDDSLARMTYADTAQFLPDDILAKVDRASMSVSLEARVPFLDHRVVEFAWRVPSAVKQLDGRGKWPLREILLRRLPDAPVDRPKAGFDIPLSDWLRGPLSDWAEDLLAEQRLAGDPLLDGDRIHQKWTQHRSGRRNWHFQLWTILMFQAWRASVGLDG